MIVMRAKALEAHALLVANYMGEIDGLPLEFDKLDKHVLTALYHSAARATHPDTGGTAEAFARVDWAKCALAQWLSQGEQPAPARREHKATKCSYCDGKGFVQRHSGFKKGARVQCVRCHGSGDADYEPDRTSGDFR